MGWLTYGRASWRWYGIARESGDGEGLDDDGRCLRPTKFGRRSLSKIVNATGVHHIITDVKLPKETSDAIRELGIKLTLV